MKEITAMEFLKLLATQRISLDEDIRVLESDKNIRNGVSIEFTGFIRGNEHTIYNIPTQLFDKNDGIVRNLTIANSNTENSIICDENTGIIEDITVENCEVNTTKPVGGLVKENNGEILKSEFIKGEVNSGKAGGIVQKNKKDGKIRSCEFNGTVFGNHKTGGITGINKGTVKKCTVLESLIQPELSVNGVGICSKTGGICGENFEEIYKCKFKNSTIKGNAYIGGIVGVNEGEIQESYIDGKISGVTGVGGISGRNNEIIREGIVKGTIKADSECGGFIGVNSKNAFCSEIATEISSIKLEEESIGTCIGINADTSTIDNCHYFGDDYSKKDLIGKNHNQEECGIEDISHLDEKEIVTIFF